MNLESVTLITLKTLQQNMYMYEAPEFISFEFVVLGIDQEMADEIQKW